jgi:hypothetical protein
MNRKLTISIEESTIEMAKKYAKAKGKSLSEIIENYLSIISASASEKKSKSISKISKLKGAVKFAEEPADYKKELSSALKKKYSK